MIWLGWVSWNSNHCRLFNAESSLYIYIYIYYIYIYILNVYDLAWLGIMAYQPLQVI